MNGYTYGSGYNGSMGPGDQHNGDDFNMTGQDSMSAGIGGQSLDDIVNQNAKVMRRQSMPHQYGQNQSQRHVNTDMRRISMMDYSGASPAGAMDNFGFDPSSGMDQSGMMASASPVNQAPAQQHQRQQSRKLSADHLGLNTNLVNSSQGYPPMMQASPAYASPAHQQGDMDLGISSPYMGSQMGISMDYSVDPNLNNPMADDSMNMRMYNQPHFNSSVMSSPMHQSASVNPQPSGRAPSKDQNGASGMNSQYSGHGSGSQSTVRQPSRSRSLHMQGVSSPARSVGGPTSQAPVGSQQTPQNVSAQHNGFPGQPQHPQPGSQQDVGMGQDRAKFDGINGPCPVDINNYNPNNQGFAWQTPEGGWPSTVTGRTHTHSSHKNAYSSTGFDMLGVLVCFDTFSWCAY